MDRTAPGLGPTPPPRPDEARPSAVERLRALAVVVPPEPGELQAAVAHDLANPIACIHSNLSFVREALGTALADLARGGGGAAGDVSAVLHEALAALDDAAEGVEEARGLARALKSWARSVE